MKNNFEIIDFHVHVFPEEVAPKALNAMFYSNNMVPATDGTFDGLLKNMNKTGVDISIVQPVATKPEQVVSINNWAIEHKHDKIIFFGAIHADFPNIQDEIDRIISLGFKGIKIQANWQSTYINDKKMNAIYEACQDKLIVLFHMGEEIAPFDVMHATPKMLAEVMKNFPKLTIVAAHLGGYLMWDEAREYLYGRNIYIDSSACPPGQLADEDYKDIILTHGTDKVLFATDSPMLDPTGEINRLLSLGLSDSDLEKIFSGNAKRLLGL